jgi:hypothetical protein
MHNWAVYEKNPRNEPEPEHVEVHTSVPSPRNESRCYDCENHVEESKDDERDPFRDERVGGNTYPVEEDEFCGIADETTDATSKGE